MSPAGSPQGVAAPDLYLISSATRSEPLTSPSGRYTAVFKLLTPGEWVEIWEEAAKYRHEHSRTMVEQIHALARCIVTLNGQGLVLAPTERELTKKALGVDTLTAAQEAAQILSDRFPVHAIQELDALANSWMVEYYEQIGLMAKKKPEEEGPGTPISGSSFTSRSSPPTPDSES